MAEKVPVPVRGSFSERHLHQNFAPITFTFDYSAWSRVTHCCPRPNSKSVKPIGVYSCTVP